MKSAIFKERQPPQTRATQRTGLRKRPQTQSPIITPSKGPRASSWNLDDLISNYTLSGSLPTPLSPTLPPRFEGKKFEPEDDEYEDDDDSNDSDVDSNPVALPPSAHLQGHKLAQPTAKAPAKAKSVPIQSGSLLTPTKNSSVRIVNKLSDLERPRFLVRINYKALLNKLKPKFNLKAQEENPNSANSRNKDIDNKLRKEPEFRPRSAWANIIKDLRSQCDRVSKSDFFFSVVLQFDSIICSIIASEPEEKPKVFNKAGVAERNWAYIHGHIPLFVSRIEKHLKTNVVSDKMKSMLSFLVAILAIVRALLLKRINVHTELQVEYYSSKELDFESLSKINDLRKLVMDSYHKIEDNFAQSQSFFKLSPPPLTVYPHSWNNRAFSIPRPSSLFLTPASDKYFLPLGPYSDLREAVAYLYSCVKEFSEIFGNEINGGVRYIFQAGQKKNRKFEPNSSLQ